MVAATSSLIRRVRISARRPISVAAPMLRQERTIPWTTILSGVAGSAVDPRDLRVSDAERAHVMSLLEKATGRGLINLAEFDERSARTVAARTRADLNAVLLDLPGLVVTGESAGPPAMPSVPSSGANPGRVEFGVGPTGAVPPSAGFGTGAGLGTGAGPSAPSSATLELTGRGSRDLRGYWVVPARILIGGSGSTRLDFCQAQLTSPVVRVEFDGNRGPVELVVPAGTSVRMDELSMRRGAVDNRVAPGGRDGMHLVLAGETRGGWIRIRQPRRSLFG
jgi:hypothetical protein